MTGLPTQPDVSLLALLELYLQIGVPISPQLLMQAMMPQTPGVSDVIGKRLTFTAAPSSPLPDKEQGRAAWTRLWGSYGDPRPADDVSLAKPFDAFPCALDRLALPKPTSPDKRIGADLTLLRIGKKPVKPLSH